MNKPVVTQRQMWFRCFPEGNIEFLLVTRGLALLLMAALAVVRSNQRPMALVALVLLLWVDYVLVLWWAIQIAADMEDLFSASQQVEKQMRGRRVRTLIAAVLPSVAAVLALAPWPTFLESLKMGTGASGLAKSLALPVFGAAFVVLLFFGQRALQRVQLGPRLWTVLLLVPVVHWLAMHRLLTRLGTRFAQRCQEQGQAPGDELRWSLGLALVLADVTWVLAVLPWGLMVVLSCWRGACPNIVPLCGTLLAGVFAVADLAAMEQLQRRFVEFVRKL